LRPLRSSQWAPRDANSGERNAEGWWKCRFFK
jgi:hypothetical protein